MEIKEKKNVARFYEAKEHHPDPHEAVIGWSSYSESYHICKFDPCVGWTLLRPYHWGANTQLGHISHWIPLPFDLPFPLTPEESEDVIE